MRRRIEHAAELAFRVVRRAVANLIRLHFAHSRRRRPPVSGRLLDGGCIGHVRVLVAARRGVDHGVARQIDDRERAAVVEVLARAAERLQVQRLVRRDDDLFAHQPFAGLVVAGDADVLDDRLPSFVDGKGHAGAAADAIDRQLVGDADVVVAARPVLVPNMLQRVLGGGRHERIARSPPAAP